MARSLARHARARRLLVAVMTLSASPVLASMLRRGGTTLVLSLVLGSCAALPPMPSRMHSRALDPGTITPLAARVAGERASARASGFHVIDGGSDALATLIWLAQSAERTLDLQYYAVLNDTSTRVLLQHVRAAAERGVRVRLLVDDFATSGADDALLRLTRHARIEVRLYNPLPAGRMSAVTKVLASLHDFDRINSRMHNKAFIADNTLAVTGGRNLGDPYFVQTKEANFVDLDLLVAGPVVHQMSASFDRFWNSDLSYPVQTVVSHAGAPTTKAPLDAPDALPEAEQADVDKRLVQLRARPVTMTWARARLVADRPSKPLADGDPAPDETLFDDLGALLRSAQREVLIVTPYFVPGETGMRMIRELRDRGVRVRVLTAAMAATDAPVVHVGYSRYREPLLQLGVELFELRPEFKVRSQSRRGLHSRTNLHAKVIVVDAQRALVGSMNVDPRSHKHNTEMGLMVHSAAVADRILAVFNDACDHGAYRVEIDDAGMRWTHRDDNGGERVWRHEPRTSLFERLGYGLLGALAPEEML